MRRVFSILLVSLLMSNSAFAEGTQVTSASQAELRKAMPHFARARQLLVTAIREFDKGYKVVNPEAILDGDEWRQTLLDRVEEMEHLLAPQARTAKEGMRFSPNPAFLSGAASR